MSRYISFLQFKLNSVFSQQTGPRNTYSLFHWYQNIYEKSLQLRQSQQFCLLVRFLPKQMNHGEGIQRLRVPLTGSAAAGQ